MRRCGDYGRWLSSELLPGSGDASPAHSPAGDGDALDAERPWSDHTFDARAGCGYEAIRTFDLGGIMAVSPRGMLGDFLCGIFFGMGIWISKWVATLIASVFAHAAR